MITYREAVPGADDIRVKLVVLALSPTSRELFHAGARVRLES
jgi:hypothetical protein